MKKAHRYKNNTLFLSLLIITLSSISDLKALVHNNLNYGYIYWEHGYPTRLISGRRSQNLANTNARSNPNLIIQTGYYSMRLDCDDMDITGFNSLSGSDYMTALNQDVTQFTPATLRLYAYVGNTRYTCTSATVQSTSGDFVRLIESGQYLQRFDMVDLVFTSPSGNDIGFSGVLEVSAWPDRVSFQLDFSDEPSVTRTTIQLITPNGTQLLTDTGGNQSFLLVKPQSQSKLSNLWAPSWVKAAYDKSTSASLNYTYSEEEAAIHIDVPAAAVSHTNHTGRVDEYIIELDNPTSSQQNIPLVFEQPTPRSITGTLMTLCHEIDGSPTGVPVQISKNWHKDTNNPTMHEGSWLRGSTMVTLAGNETKRLRLRVIYGYWGDAATASHAQLSLIGYSGNWKWDQSALGSWGEALTYDPTQHIGGSFMCDIRPAFTSPMNGSSSHGWTENVGGGEFLVYFDSNNTYRWLKRVKTAYKWTGPNITEIHYSGVTDDNKIRANYTVSLVRTNDCHRSFFDYSYEFLSSVSNPSRLAFFTMAADYYNTVDFNSYHRGHAGGKAWDYTASPGGNTYKSSLYFKDRWLAIDDNSAGASAITARRGLLAYESTLNGSQFVPYLHTYGRTWGADKMNFDLSSSSITKSYSAGDVVKGKLGFVLIPNDDSEYWGTDSAFNSRLSSYSNAWSGVFDEYRYNRNMSVSTSSGTLVNNYPVEITANNNSSVLAHFTVASGRYGIGHIPVILRDVNEGYELAVQVYDSGWKWISTYTNVSVGQNDYYQGVLNASGKMDYCFNVVRPDNNQTGSFQVRILRRSSAN